MEKLWQQRDVCGQPPILLDSSGARTYPPEGTSVDDAFYGWGEQDVRRETVTVPDSCPSATPSVEMNSYAANDNVCQFDQDGELVDRSCLNDQVSERYNKAAQDASNGRAIERSEGE